MCKSDQIDTLAQDEPKAAAALKDMDDQAASSEYNPAAPEEIEIAVKKISEWYNKHRASIDKAGDAKGLFQKLHYARHVILPYLELRSKYIESYCSIKSFTKNFREAGKRTLTWYEAIEKGDAAGATEEAIDKDLKTLTGWAKDTLAKEANTPLHKAPDLAGGYAADEKLRPTMNAMILELEKLASDGKTLSVPGKKNIPIISKNNFNGAEKVPWALKRLVKDIHYFWRIDEVLDARSETDREENRKTPDEAGALRTHHMNDAGTLPVKKKYNGSHKLHHHYWKYSQGSSVHGRDKSGSKDKTDTTKKTPPIGYAEYTGIDSDQNKIVLDYESGRVYITCTHYQHWYKDGKRVEKLETEYQLSVASGKCDESKVECPWVLIEFS